MVDGNFIDSHEGDCVLADDHKDGSNGMTGWPYFLGAYSHLVLTHCAIPSPLL